MLLVANLQSGCPVGIENAVRAARGGGVAKSESAFIRPFQLKMCCVTTRVGRSRINVQ
jgi:hypothetical protein